MKPKLRIFKTGSLFVNRLSIVITIAVAVFTIPVGMYNGIKLSLDTVKLKKEEKE